MTIFASLITSGILILMAVSCLVISERGLTHNTYERFLNNGNSCVAYLENQTVLSHKWILEAKQEYKVEFRILNNGKKLYFDKLDTESWNQDKKEENLSSVGNMLTEAARISREEQGLDVDYMGSLSLSKTVYFETSDFYVNACYSSRWNFCCDCIWILEETNSYAATKAGGYYDSNRAGRTFWKDGADCSVCRI